MAQNPKIDRRQFLGGAAGAVLAPGLLAQADLPGFRLNYMLASCLYGYEHLESILPEVRKTGAESIDLWPKVHGAQREQLDEMGEERFAALLRRHRVRLGCITQYKLGPFGLENEMRLASRLGCPTIVTGARGPKGLAGDELKRAVRDFIEKLKPHLAVAEETGVTLAIENHDNNLLETADAMKWLAELRPSSHLAIAFAPYHLPQSPWQLADLIRTLGDRIQVFYAWQHGLGCHEKLPKSQELLQMPGRGPLDFQPMLQALREIRFQGPTEIFMHPVPRGVPIHDSVEAVTREVNMARGYLDKLLARTSRQKGSAMNQVLIIVGDATETVDTLYPYYRLIEAGFKPVVAAPENRRYQMVLHEVKPGWTITKEWEGYSIQADVAFSEIDPTQYVGIFFSGGRAPEYIRYDEDLVRITRHFFEANKPIGCVCHGVEIPAYAGCVKGRRMATVGKCKFDLEVCGGIFVDEPCVIDNNLVSGRTYHDHGHYIGPWIKLLEAAREAAG